MTEAQAQALFGDANSPGAADSGSSLLGGVTHTGTTPAGFASAGFANAGFANSGPNALTGSQQQLIASALASRNAAFGIPGLTGASGLAGAAASGTANSGTANSGTAATNRIASKSAVASIEGRLANGRLSDDQLAPLGIGSHKLHPEATSAFQQLMAAAQADGIDIKITDSYRSYDAQVDVARRKGLYSQGGLAAKPGTSSHGYGLAVDLDLNAQAQSWMRANGARFGFVEDTPREPWHWKFDGV
ncbi:MAG: peptidase M15 [Actinobacteria bacterium]|nr:peptidase M15 [Actinomycetota bacterium]